MTNIYIKTYGCALNKADSETMAGLLENAGFKIIDKAKPAELIIINTCTVKGPSESKFMTYLKKIEEKYPKKKIIITGCIAQTDSKKLKGYSLLGTSQLNNIVEVVEETLHGNIVVLIAKDEQERLNLPKKRRNKIIAIVPICEGCLGDPCSYCKVKSARGNLKSYPIEKILTEIREAKKDGCKEIWLTAQDTGCYGLDIKTNIATLLEKACDIPGDFKIRLGMCNPNYAIDFLEDMIKIFKNDKMFKFLHIPVQSGNNEVLKNMRRKYDVEDFYNICNEIRKEILEITIATDIIVGFPGETKEQFDDSLKLIKDLTPDVVNISRFWGREGTEAYDMENQIPGDESKKRSKIITSIFRNISRMQNERWIGWQGEILIDEYGKDDTMIARNFTYKPIIVKGKHNIGEKINVKIKSATTFYLNSEMI